MIGALIGPVASLIGALGGKLIGAYTAKKEQKHEIKKAETAIKIKAAESEDSALLHLVKDSWKDEAVMVCFGTPVFLLLVLLPLISVAGYDVAPANKAIMDGIKALDKLPEYYWWIIGVIVLKSFGVPVGAAAGKIFGVFTSRSK